MVKDAELLSTGSTQLNLACSGRAKGAFHKGRFYLFVGDSDSGKTLVLLTTLAEACINKHFKDYRLIYDNIEDGALMSIEKMFGKQLAARIEPPCTEDGEPKYSETIEELYYNISELGKEGKPFIYFADSMDALTSEDETKKFEETRKAFRRGAKTAGSYGDGKAKKNSQYIRLALQAVRNTDSILIIVCQSRDSLGFGFETKTRSGGRALTFYNRLEIWFSRKQKIRKSVKGKNRQLGIMSKVQTKKNHVTGKDRTIEIPIYYSYGVDDIGSCVDFLVDEKHWKARGKKIKCEPDFDIVATRDKIIAHIEKHNLYNELQDIVQDVWDEIEEACVLKRKRRYT